MRVPSPSFRLSTPPVPRELYSPKPPLSGTSELENLFLGEESCFAVAGFGEGSGGVAPQGKKEFPSNLSREKLGSCKRESMMFFWTGSLEIHPCGQVTDEAHVTFAVEAVAASQARELAQEVCRWQGKVFLPLLHAVGLIGELPSEKKMNAGVLVMELADCTLQEKKFEGEELTMVAWALASTLALLNEAGLLHESQRKPPPPKSATSSSAEEEAPCCAPHLTWFAFKVVSSSLSTLLYIHLAPWCYRFDLGMWLVSVTIRSP